MNYNSNSYSVSLQIHVTYNCISSLKGKLEGRIASNITGNQNKKV